MVQDQESEFHPMAPQGARADSWELSDLTSTRHGLNTTVKRKRWDTTKDLSIRKTGPGETVALPNKC